MKTKARAVLWRTGLYFVPMAIFLAFFAVDQAPANTAWPLIIVFFGAFGIVWITISTKTDRRFQVRSGTGGPVGFGAQASCILVVTAVPLGSSVETARQAVALSGGRNVEVIDGQTVIGWIGSSYQHASMAAVSVGDRCFPRP